MYTDISPYTTKIPIPMSPRAQIITYKQPTIIHMNVPISQTKRTNIGGGIANVRPQIPVVNYNVGSLTLQPVINVPSTSLRTYAMPPPIIPLISQPTVNVPSTPIRTFHMPPPTTSTIPTVFNFPLTSLAKRTFPIPPPTIPLISQLTVIVPPTPPIDRRTFPMPPPTILLISQPVISVLPLQPKKYFRVITNVTLKKGYFLSNELGMTYYLIRSKPVECIGKFPFNCDKTTIFPENYEDMLIPLSNEEIMTLETMGVRYKFRDFIV